MAAVGPGDIGDVVEPESKSPLPLQDDSSARSGSIGQSLDTAARSWDLVMENYQKQSLIWPVSGKHILAHFDEESVVVYQAFKPSIAEYAVTHQRFGGPEYNPDRMTWVKTNFMWMMFRCGWAQKVDQERVLAVRLTKEGFEDILSKASTAQKQKVKKLDETVRLQWDPDHDLRGAKLERRAIQLGLKGQAALEYTSKHILFIKDITEFVREQYRVLQSHDSSGIMSPRERVYTPESSDTCSKIDLGFCAEQSVVSFGT